MPGTIASLSLAALVAMVARRVVLLKREGIEALQFGKLDRTDFLIPPFMLYYFYNVFAASFDWPGISRERLFDSQVMAWLGALLCAAGAGLLWLSIASFGRSFRIGIDIERPDRLVTGGVFALSRNPIYVAFWCVFFGQFLVFPSPVLLAYLLGATWLFHRQVLREEAFLKQHYGEQYAEYCRRVRRYI